MKSRNITVILSFLFIPPERINSEKNGFCRHHHQLVDWRKGVNEPKRKALKQGLLLLWLGTMLHYETSFQKFLISWSLVFLFSSREWDEHHVPGKALIYAMVTSRSPSMTEVCSSPFAPYLSSSGPKKRTAENAPLSGRLCPDTDLRPGSMLFASP